MSALVPDQNVYWKAAQALVAAANLCLTDNGLPAPAIQYVSTRGEINLEANGPCGCEQLVVIPGDIQDPELFNLDRNRCGWRHQFNYQLGLGRCITEWIGDGECLLEPGDPGDPCGDPFAPPPAPNPGEPASVQYESWLVARDRWVLWNCIRDCWLDQLCACLPQHICNGATAQRGLMTPDVGGGCEWSILTVSVRL